VWANTLLSDPLTKLHSALRGPFSRLADEAPAGSAQPALSGRQRGSLAVASLLILMIVQLIALYV
jgi:hypothetical protein